MKSFNELYCTLCRCTEFSHKHFLVGCHQNTTKHQKALGRWSQLLIPCTSQMFLRSSNTDFVKKVSKVFLSSDIPLYKLHNKHINSLFHDIGHNLPSEITCLKTVLQLSTIELQRIRNAIGDKFLWLLMRALYLACNS